MPSLYVVEPGALVEKEYDRLLVTCADRVLFRVPLSRVSQVVLVGAVGLTTPALQALLRASIPLQLVRKTGQLLGCLVPGYSTGLAVRQAQYRHALQGEFCRQVTRSILRGKLHNQRVLALRVLRRRPQADRTGLAHLRDAERQVPAAPTLDVLRGIEGTAARAYFAIYRQAFARSWGFVRRVRRPATDPINALLSLGYVVVGQAVAAALQSAALDPALGFFHASRPGRPARALDLLEEFRAPLVDSLVMVCINRRILQPDHFRQAEDHSVRLTDPGLRAFLHRLGQRLDAPLRLPGSRRPITWRKALEVQAHRLARHVLEPSLPYVPFLAR